MASYGGAVRKRLGSQGPLGKAEASMLELKGAWVAEKYGSESKDEGDRGALLISFVFKFFGQS